MTNSLSAFALIVIGIVLLGQSFVDYVRPALILRQHKTAYLELATKCHESRASSVRFDRLSNEIDPALGTLLRRSSSIALLDCLEHMDLRRSLLSKGVDDNHLNVIDFRALEASNTPAPYVLRELGIR